MNKKYDLFKYILELLVIALVPFAYIGYQFVFIESLLKNKKPEPPFKTISKSMYYGFSYTIGIILLTFTIIQIAVIFLLFGAMVVYVTDSTTLMEVLTIITALLALIVLPLMIQIINLIYLKNKTINSFFDIKECWRLFKKDIRGWIGLYIKIILFMLLVIAIIILFPLTIFLTNPILIFVGAILLVLVIVPLIFFLPPFIMLKISEFAASQYKRTKYIK